MSITLKELEQLEKHRIEECKRLGQMLRRGDKSRIAKKLDLNRDMVSVVFKGEAYREDVIDAALEILDERAEEEKRRILKIKNAIQKYEG